MLGIQLGRNENTEEFVTGNHGVGSKTTTRKKMEALKVKTTTTKTEQKTMS